MQKACFARSKAYSWAACSDVKPLNLEILKGTFPTCKVLKPGVFSSSSSCTDRGQGDKNAGNTCIVILYPSKFWNVFQGQRDPGAGDQQCPQRLSKTGPEASLKAHSQWARTQLGSPALTSQVRNFLWHHGCQTNYFRALSFPFTSLCLSPESWEAGEKNTWGSGGSGVKQLN